jgi:hypothetical protein
MSNTKKTIEWVILIIIGLLVAISCTDQIPLDEIDIYHEQLSVEGSAFPTTNGSQDYQQVIYLDTLQSFTYTKIYAESNDMADHQKYNGEANILATFSTDKHWNYSDGIFDDYPVYYVYPTSVRFVEPASNHQYEPSTLALFTQQMVGPIPKSAIINREKVKIYMDVSYDGEYYVKDSLLVELRPR